MRFILLFLLISISFTSSAQVNEEYGGVINANLLELKRQYQHSIPDTNRVKTLLKIDSLYLYKMADVPVILDSAVLLAQQARALSANLHYEWGYDEATFLLANSYAEKEDMRTAIAIMNECSGDLQVRILIMIGEHFTFRLGELKENLDSAYPFIIRAKRLSDFLRSPILQNKSLCLLAKYHFANGSLAEGRKCFMQIIEGYQHSGDKANEANWWGELGRYLPHTDSTLSEAIQYFSQSRLLYHQINNSEEEIDALKNIAYLQLLKHNLDSAEAGFLEVVRLNKQRGEKRLFGEYSNLTRINLAKGNYHKMLFYALAAVNNVDSIEETDRAGLSYSQLADAYRVLGNNAKSLQWYRLALDRLVTYRVQYLYTICSRIVHALIAMDSTKEALAFIVDFAKHNPPPRFVDKEIVAAAIGDCYNDLGNYDLAEKKYLQMIALDSAARDHFKNVPQGEIGNIITGSEAYFTIGQFYVGRKKFEIARPYLNRAMLFKRFAPTLSRVRDLHQLLFKADSAKGNYLSAIEHLRLYNQLNETIFNTASSQQINELQIEYETDKKEKNLRVLQAMNQLQRKALEGSEQARNFTYTLLAILIILIGVGFSRYRIKQKSNRLLAIKQNEINQKNSELQDLIGFKDRLINEKDVLLEEKEWLLKEVHHRVKNNLQTVSSLLNTQTKYLNSKEAIAAINESRHRMQAISLVHQKLYQSENTTSVNMQNYIGELCEYLGASYRLAKDIAFRVDVDQIQLDAAVAIPIGFILNEAITNSIKYAFPDKRIGSITISMRSLRNDAVALEIRDDGIGLPDGFDVRSSNTMGMRLIKGLVRQINGELSIENNAGVHMRMTFQGGDSSKIDESDGESDRFTASERETNFRVEPVMIRQGNDIA